MSSGLGEVKSTPGRQSLLRAAARLAARSSSARALGLREVAREAGLNHNTFYRHFAGMDELVDSLVTDFCGDLRAGLTRARERAAPGAPPTPAVMRWLFDFARDHADVFVVAMREWHGPGGPARETVRAMMDELCRDMARDLTLAGHVPAIDSRRLHLAAELIVAHAFHLCLDYLEKPRRRAQLIERATEVFVTVMAGAMALESAEKD